MMLLKCSVVVAYFTTLFVVTRLLEFVGVVNRGMKCSERSNMLMVNTTQLKQVLDRRGVSYEYVTGRSELMSLVNNSGKSYNPLIFITVVNSSSHSVNGDIAIQWNGQNSTLTESNPLNRLR